MVGVTSGFLGVAAVVGWSYSKELAGIVRDLMLIGNYLTPAAKTLPNASYYRTPQAILGKSIV